MSPPQPGVGVEPVQAIVARVTHRVHGAVLVHGASDGLWVPFLGLVVVRVVARVDLKACPVPHLLFA